MDAIERTWKEFPSEFYRINRGFVLSADSVSWDKNSKMVEIVLADPKKHGVIDGAHTLAKLVEALIPATYGPEDAADSEEDVVDEADDENDGSEDAISEEDRFVSCEVWIDLTLDEVARLTEGRNTSRSVPPYAISNLRGDFKAVETKLRAINLPYAEKVAFKPNEHMEFDDENGRAYKPVSAIDILQLMMCMDVTNYSDTDQPIEAYKNAGFIPKFWDKKNDRNRIAEYGKMLPILGDILELYDRIREVIPQAYDERDRHLSKIPRRWNKVLVKKGQRVEKAEIESLYYLDPTGDRKAFRSPHALFYPIICAFRAALRVNGDKYEWWGGTKPTAWPAADFTEACLRLAVNIASLAKKKDSLHAVGTDEAVWTACYETLNSFLFEYKIKNRDKTS